MRTLTFKEPPAAPEWCETRSGDQRSAIGGPAAERAEGPGPGTKGVPVAEAGPARGGRRVPAGSRLWLACPFDEYRLRFARCRASHFFRAAGVEDPSVLAAASQHAVRVAVRSLRDADGQAAIARLPGATIAAADAMRRRTIRRLDARLPGVGGASRRGALSMRLASVLAERPECLLQKNFSDEVVRLARGKADRRLEMPTEDPVHFPPQALVATRPNRFVAGCRTAWYACRTRLARR